MIRIVRASLFAVLCAPLAAPAVAADSYPERPVRLIVPFAPGGGVDINARILAEPLGQALGQTIVADNRPGASSIIGTKVASMAAPDGYTLLINAVTVAINAAVYKKLPFDIQRDFAPVSRLTQQPNILVANPSLPAKTAQEFVALVRSQPGKYSFGSAGLATGIRLAMEMLLLKANAKMVHVPYKSLSPALVGLLGNEVSVLVSTFASALPHVKAGRLRAYGVTTAQRVDLLPDVPTLAESGVPGYDYATWYGLFVPAGTPPHIIDKLNKVTVTALKSPKLTQIYQAQGLTATPSSPAEFARFIDSELKKWTDVVRDAKIERQ